MSTIKVTKSWPWSNSYSPAKPMTRQSLRAIRKNMRALLHQPMVVTPIWIPYWTPCCHRKYDTIAGPVSYCPYHCDEAAVGGTE